MDGLFHYKSLNDDDEYVKLMIKQKQNTNTGPRTIYVYVGFEFA
jgi:hypothetical protein